MKNHMKTILFTAAFSLLLAGGISVQADAQVAINDDNFSWAVKEYAVEADDNGDGYLSEKEAAGVTTVRFDSKQNIDSFRGIEYFTDLKDFFYRANIASAGNDDEIWSYEDSTASELDLSGMKKLERVRIICHNSYLRSVDLGDCPKLEYVYIRGRECVDSLNLRGCTGLETLECSSLTVEKLNLSKLKKLETVTLYLHGGKLQKLNLKKCSGLKTLLVISDTVKEVKLKEAKKLENIRLAASSLETLDLSTNTGLKVLDCSAAQLSSLDVRNNKKLEKIDCNGNLRLTELKVKGCTKLKNIRCYNTALTKLNVKKNPNLKKLYCDQTGISTLNLKNNRKLKTLVCTKTNIQNLDLSNTKIRDASGLQCDEGVSVIYAD